VLAEQERAYVVFVIVEEEVRTWACVCTVTEVTR
jgi:hypothetical protein